MRTLVQVLVLGVLLVLLGGFTGWMLHEYNNMEVGNEVVSVSAVDVQPYGVCVSCCPVTAIETPTPTATEEPVCVLASPTSGPTITFPTETPRPTRGPTDVPTATPPVDPTDTPEPKPTKRVNCNNGGGNGSEGCSPSEQGHDDENQDHQHGGGHK